MIIFFICLFILLVGVAGTIIYCNSDNYDLKEASIWIRLPGYIFGGASIFLCSCVMILTNCNVAKEKLRVELNETIVELNSTYTYLQEHELDNSISRINTVEYNDKVKKFKRDISFSKISLNNPWVNWFTSSVYKEYTGNEVEYLKGE